MIVLMVRTHGVEETASREYADTSAAVEALDRANIADVHVAEILDRRVLAYVGMHADTGQRFAVWRGRDTEEN